MSDVDALFSAARAAASYERDDAGSPWCGVCHRTVADCDAEPTKHFSDDVNLRLQGYGCSFRPNERLCPGHRLRDALRIFNDQD